MMRRDMGLPIGRFLLLVGLLLAVVLPGYAAETYYVNNNTTGPLACAGCSDSNTCTQAQTITTGFDTLDKCITCMSAAGTDRCELRGGTYTEVINSNVRPIPAGTTFGNANTIARYQNEVPILTAVFPTGTGQIVNLPLATDAYIILDGLTIEATNAHLGMSIGAGTSGGAHHIRVTNCDIRNSQGSGVQLRGTFNEVINSKIHGSQNAYGFYTIGSDLLIHNNEIYDNAGYGVTVFNTGGGPQRVTVSNNRFFNNGHPRGQPALQMGSGSDHLAFNNLIYGNYRGANTFGGCVDCKWYFNTLYNNRDGFTFGSGTQTGTIIRNNLLYLSGIVSTGGTGSVRSNNMEATVNPFVNAAANNFALAASSAPIDQGVTVVAVPLDFGGKTRAGLGAAPDIGAFEFGEAGPLHLVFSTPPQTAVEGTVMPVVVAQVLDSANAVQTGQTGNCTASKSSGPGTVNGTLVVAAVAGVCTFPHDWSISQDGTYVIAMAYTGATGATASVVITDAAAPPEPPVPLVSSFRFRGTR